MQLRKFRPEDVPAIVALFRDTIHRINVRDYSPEQVRAWAPDEIDGQRWKDLLAGRCSLVVESNGAVVGFGDIEDNGHLDHLYVHADHQGCGVGRALLAALEADSGQRGIGRVFTEASITARPFFEHHGYRVLAEQVVTLRGVDFVNFRMEKIL